MKPQMNRQQYLIVAEQLLDCIEQSTDVLNMLGEIYVRSVPHFDARENDIDPSSVAIGLQAQFLGVKTLYQWLEALSKHTSSLYYLRGQEYLKEAQVLMNQLGIVIPDTLML